MRQCAAVWFQDRRRPSRGPLHLSWCKPSQGPRAAVQRGSLDIENYCTLWLFFILHYSDQLQMMTLTVVDIDA